MSYFWVFIGGGLGSMCRFALGKWFNPMSDFLWGTFLANLLSCILLGALLALAAKDTLSPTLRFLLVAGFCGGFSTFSTFSAELILFLKDGQYFSAGVYLLLSVLSGLAAVLVGMKVME